MEVWIPVCFVPQDDIPIGYTDLFISAVIPDSCAICGHKNKYYKNHVGSKTEMTSFDSLCNHYNTWQVIWSNRIKQVNSISHSISNNILIPPTYKAMIKKNHIDPTKDGCRCSGLCGSWNPMAVPNRDDGTFICYGCRTSF